MGSAMTVATAERAGEVPGLTGVRRQTLTRSIDAARAKVARLEAEIPALDGLALKRKTVSLESTRAKLARAEKQLAESDEARKRARKQAKAALRERIAAGGKVCTKCKGDPQPMANFPPHKHTRDGRQSWCKTCRNVLRAAWGKTETGKLAKRKGDARYQARVALKKAREKVARLETKLAELESAD